MHIATRDRGTSSDWVATHNFASTLESLPSCWCSCSCKAAMGLVLDLLSLPVSTTYLVDASMCNHRWSAHCTVYMYGRIFGQQERWIIMHTSWLHFLLGFLTAYLHSHLCTPQESASGQEISLITPQLSSSTRSTRGCSGLPKWFDCDAKPSPTAVTRALQKNRLRAAFEVHN